MREIKFRGLGSDKCWRYTSTQYARHPYTEKMVDFWMNVYSEYIDPATVGQWTGLRDCKGVDVYEGDIVENEDTYGDNPPEFSKYEVKFVKGSFYLAYIGDEGDDYNCDILIQPLEVIGNIHEVKNDQPPSVRES